jgi:three-Cys-motif partner protein
MPPTRHTTIWPAEPHTIAKIEILKGYLFAWFQILGPSRRGQDLLYIDGFAGPGAYSNYETSSPLAALTAAQTALSATASGCTAGDLHCAFIEADPQRFAHLRERVAPFQDTPKLHINLFQGSFVDGLARLKEQLPRPFEGSDPLLVFID